MGAPKMLVSNRGSIAGPIYGSQAPFASSGASVSPCGLDFFPWSLLLVLCWAGFGLSSRYTTTAAHRCHYGLVTRVEGILWKSSISRKISKEPEASVCRMILTDRIHRPHSPTEARSCWFYCPAHDLLRATSNVSTLIPPER